MSMAKCVFATGFALSSWAAPAHSGSGTQGVEVVGSRLPRLETEGIAPVQVITAEDIRRSNVGNLAELLGLISSVSGGLPDYAAGGSFASGSTPTSMRGLGAQATLVLLNFRRVAPYPLANFSEVFTNIDALPFEAIERIEILKGGAAALYGTDAIAGVINIITKRDFVGVQARASHERSTTSGRFGNTTASVTAGFATPGYDGGHVLANLEVFHRDGLMWRDVLQYVDPARVARSPNFGTLSTYSWPGNVIGAGPIAGCAPELLQNGLCLYDRYARFEVRPGADRVNLLVNAGLPMSQGRRGFGELLLADNRTRYQFPLQAYGPALTPITWGDPVNDTIQTFTYRGLPAGHPLNPTGKDGAQLRYRFIDGPNQETARTLQYRALAGLAGQWKDLDWEAATGVMGGRTDLSQRGWYSVKGFREVIGNYDPGRTDPLFFNRDYKIGQTNSPAVLDKLFPSYGYRGHVRQVFVDGKLSGAVAQLPSGPLNLALGGELRHERFTITPSAALLAGDIVGNGLTASDAARLMGSVFAETTAKINAATELQAAARIDQFGSLAPHLSPRLGLRLQPSPGWLVRASAETGFRAPNLTETADSTKFSISSPPDPRRCPQASKLAADLRQQADTFPTGSSERSLLSARADSVVTAECLGAVASVVRQNPNLKPETSRSLNAGIVLSPGKKSSVSIDAWDIRRRNEIGLKGISDVLAAEAAQPTGTVTRAALAADTTFTAAEQLRYGVTAGSLRSVIDRFDNLSRTQTQGFDILGQTQFDTGIGSLSIRLDASYLSKFRVWSAERGGWGDNLTGRDGHPRWRLTHSATFQRGHWSHTLQTRAISGTALHGDYSDTTYSDEGCAAQGYSRGDCRSAGHTRWDYALQFSGWSQTTVALGVANLFRTREPGAIAGWLNAGGIAPNNPDDARGRTVRLTLEWRGK